MELQLFGSGWDLQIPSYSIVGNLLFDLASTTTDSELSAWEKLFVFDQVAHPIHQGYLADIFLACGCFAEARKFYEQPEHPRKLGDISWYEGDLDQAEAHYSTVRSAAQAYRTSPDYDRLLKLAFFREQWERVVEIFLAIGFSPGFNPGNVCVGSGEAAGRPFLDMLAVALVRAELPTPTRMSSILDEAFNVDPAQWADFLAGPKPRDAAFIAKLRKRCRPKLGAAEACSRADAVARGDTPRAQRVAAYVSDADRLLGEAQGSLAEFARSGSEDALTDFLRKVTDSGITSVSHSFLFAAFGHGSFPQSAVPPERMARVLSSHPIMQRRHFGYLLELRFVPMARARAVPVQA